MELAGNLRCPLKQFIYLYFGTPMGREAVVSMGYMGVVVPMSYMGEVVPMDGIRLVGA